MSSDEVTREVKTWWLDRAKEPSTYQGLAMLFGVLGQHFFGGPTGAELGRHALDIGLAIAGVIQLGKREAR